MVSLWVSMGLAYQVLHIFKIFFLAAFYPVLNLDVISGMPKMRAKQVSD